MPSLSGSATKYCFIISDQDGTTKKILEECFLKEFTPALSLTRACLLVKTSSTNEARFDKGLQYTIAGTLSNSKGKGALRPWLRWHMI